MPGGQRGRIRGHRLGLHADDADRRVEILDRHRRPGGEAAPADRDDHRTHLRALLHELEAEGSLPRHHVRVVVGVDEDGAGPLGVGEGLSQGVFHARTVQHDLRPVAARGLDLGQRGTLGHDHGGLAAEQAGRERDALGVVARAGRDDAAGPFGIRQAGDPDVGAAYLERPGPLQVLALQVDRPGDGLGQHPRVHHGGFRDHIAEQLARRHHVVGADAMGRARCHGHGRKCATRPAFRCPACDLGHMRRSAITT